MESEKTNDDGALGYWAKHRREIPMYRWFKAANGDGAPFVVVDRITRGTGKDFETVALKILVYPTNYPETRDIDKFFAALAQNLIVEIKPDEW